MARRKDGLEQIVQQGMFETCKEKFPGLFQVLVDLVNQGESKQKILAHVHRLIGSRNITESMIYHTIDQLLQEKREAIDSK